MYISGKVTAISAATRGSISSDLAIGRSRNSGWIDSRMTNIHCEMRASMAT